MLHCHLSRLRLSQRWCTSAAQPTLLRRCRSSGFLVASFPLVRAPQSEIGAASSQTAIGCRTDVRHTMGMRRVKQGTRVSTDWVYWWVVIGTVALVGACSGEGESSEGTCRVGEPSSRVIDIHADVFEPLARADIESAPGSFSTIDDGTTLRVGVPPSQGAGALCPTAREVNDITGVPVLAVLEEIIPVAS